MSPTPKSLLWLSRRATPLSMRRDSCISDQRPPPTQTERCVATRSFSVLYVIRSRLIVTATLLPRLWQLPGEPVTTSDRRVLASC